MTPDDTRRRRLHYGRLLRQLLGLALRRPALVFPLLGAAWRFRARGWYRRPPFLPLPPGDYVAWRLHTAYGDESAVPPARELARYVRWADRFGGSGGGRVPAAGGEVRSTAGRDGQDA